MVNVLKEIMATNKPIMSEATMLNGVIECANETRSLVYLDQRHWPPFGGSH